MITFKDFVTEAAEKEQEFKTRTFRVPVEHIPMLEKKLEKANKVAKKLGVKPAEIVFLERKMEKIKSDSIRGDKYREYQYLQVVGETPILAGGWAFAGKLEPHESGTIVKSAPGHKIPARFHSADPTHCEHCNKQRRRNETFIVKKGRKYTQVGRSCLKDFTGHPHPEKYADQAEWIYDLEKSFGDSENDGWGGGRYSIHSDTKAIIAAAHAAIKRDGFVGSNHPDYNKERTSATVNKHFNPPTGDAAKYHTPLVDTPEDEQLAAETIEWVKQKAKTDKSEFFQNLNKFVSVQANDLKYSGYLAAAAMMYQKEKGALELRKKEGVGIKSEAIGKEGDKVKITAEVISAFKYQRQSYHYYDNGVSQVLTMKDPQGRLIKMFTTNLDVKKGDTVILSGKLGKAAPETYDKSPFKDKIVTSMAPRARIEIQPKKNEDGSTDSDDIKGNIKSVVGKPVPENVTKIEMVYSKSNQWEVTLKIYTKDKPDGFEKTFKVKDVEFNN